MAAIPLILSANLACAGFKLLLTLNTVESKRLLLNFAVAIGRRYFWGQNERSIIGGTAGMSCLAHREQRRDLFNCVCVS